MTILTHALCIIGAFAVAISIHAPTMGATRVNQPQCITAAVPRQRENTADNK